MSKPETSVVQGGSAWASVYPWLVGAFLGLGILKFGNPVILDGLITPPQDIFELLFQSWPATWGYMLLFGLAALGIPLVKLPKVTPAWMVWLPLIWLGWQMLAATRTVNAQLTHQTLPHFIACVVCFYLGFAMVGGLPKRERIWTGLLVAFAYALFKGFSQHHGELEATRRYFFLYTDPSKIDPDLAARLNSDRIFSTLLYPNTFAGVILLLLPASLVYLFNSSVRWPRILRGVALGVLAYMAVVCLLWSGSKGGLLIGLVMTMVFLLRVRFSRAAKLALVGVVLVGGLTGFFIKYRGYIEKGATSVGARFDYWKVGVRTVMENPLLGTGPGTFQVVYQSRKPAHAEMARLAHNDYLQQASDSGVIGGLVYLLFIVGSLVLLYRKSEFSSQFSRAIWLGLVGLGMQASSEFWLYIPALGWTIFFLLGWLWSATVQSPDSKPV